MATTSQSLSGRWSYRRVVGVLGILGLLTWLGWVHLIAWYNLRGGRAALANQDPGAAALSLERCLQTWPQHAEAHYLAGVADRKNGKPTSAKLHISLAEEFGYPEVELRFEKAMLIAKEGPNPIAVRELQDAVRIGHAYSIDAIEILVPYLMSEFRIPESGDLTAKWVELAPTSISAWTFRANVLERLGRKQEAIDAIRKLIDLDTANRSGRLSLARLILETRAEPNEAATHLEWLTNSDPTDSAAFIELAACREAQGRPEEGLAILDRMIARAPDSRAIYYRGRIEMNRGRPELAVPLLRQAADLDPSNVEILYSLFACLQRTGTPEEIRLAEVRWRKCEADRKRVGELARAIGAAPTDPNLRREMGEIFLRNGRTSEGKKWLESALRIMPDRGP